MQLTKKIGVLASGQGSNLQAIIDAEKRGELAGKVSVVVSDNPDAYVLKRAKDNGIKDVVLDSKKFISREEYDQALLKILNEESLDFVVLAGFMRLLSRIIVSAYPGRIMNIHPSLLPSFPGKDGIKKALEHGVKITGCTVHFVDEELDNGPIIIQEAVPIFQEDTEETLWERVQAAEHRNYPRAIDLFCRDLLKIEGRRCFIYGPEE